VGKKEGIKEELGGSDAKRSGLIEEKVGSSKMYSSVNIRKKKRENSLGGKGGKGQNSGIENLSSKKWKMGMAMGSGKKKC